MEMQKKNGEKKEENGKKNETGRGGDRKTLTSSSSSFV